MKRTLLISAALALCLAWPAAVLADPPTNQGGGADQGGHGPDKAKDQPATGSKGQTGARGEHAGQRAAAVAGAARDTVASAPAATVAKGRDRQRAAVYAPPTPAATAQHEPRLAGQRGNNAAGPAFSGVESSQNFQTQQGQLRFGQRQARARGAMQPPANQPALAHWDRAATGPARSQASQQWRQANSGWDSHALWRRNADWWRTSSAFRLFSGARIGFFFIPEQGYVAVPAEYQTHYWRTGDQLPDWFWRYAVRDYWNYGLPQPPDGCTWVWVDNDIALIDASDGYILDIVHNAW